MNMNFFSIIIPVFNAQICLNNTVEACVVAMERMGEPYEIILVDDGSVDASWTLIKQLKDKYKAVNGVRLTKNYGQHNALLCGLNVCKGDYIITLDDDLEQQPDDIEKLYQFLLVNDRDMVYGVPLKQKKSFFRNFYSQLYKRMSRIENKQAGSGSSFRVLTRKLKDDLIKHTGSLFFLDEIALWYSSRIGYVTVEFKESKKTNSGYGYSSLFTLSLRVLSLSSTMPLRLVRVVGFYIFGFSLFLGIVFIIRKFLLNVPLGYTSLMVTILFGTGIITASLGVIGEYLGNLIALSNNKPSYAIKEKT